MRSLSTAVLAALAEPTVQLALFVELAFADNTYYFFSGIGSITPAGPPANPLSTFPYGETFTGMGWLAKLSAVPQTTKVQAQNITLTLSGIPSVLVPEVTTQVRITGTATVWLGIFDGNGNLLADPAQIFYGSLDVPSGTDAGGASTFSISCENALLSLNLAPNRRFDDADQQIYLPGDLGFSFVDQLPNTPLFWPAPSTTTSPYPLYMTVSITPEDIPVGGTATVQVTITYSDMSTYTQPARTGSGPFFLLDIASSNPKIATCNYQTTNQILGVGPGVCSIQVRSPSVNSGGGGFAQVFRAAANLVVHS